jgi:hypothetical protein
MTRRLTAQYIPPWENDKEKGEKPEKGRQGKAN